MFATYAEEFEDFRTQLAQAMDDYQSAEPARRPALGKQVVLGLDELGELLKQMELEARGAAGPARQTLNSRLVGFRKVRAEAQKSWRQAKELASAGDRDALLTGGGRGAGGDGGLHAPISSHEHEMESLIARSGSRLNDTRRILADTTDLGAGVLSDLDAQRRQLEGSQTKLREADSNVAMAVAVMKRMKARALRNKITLAFIVLMLLATIGFLIFELLDPTSSPTVETEESADQPPPPSPPGP
eukprot:COSAG01_NODE_5199_length_4416_cov_3.151031_2_plen_244_part_00